jgi:rare lipoprotein A (peptidoglycan hydrolase)
MSQLIAAGLTLAALINGPHHARHVATRPMSYAVASWYQDGGSTASGWHSYYGVANKYLRFGTRVLFRYHGRTVRAVVDDRGPYVYGRTWDFNQNVARALGMWGVATVGYRIGGSAG